MSAREQSPVPGGGVTAGGSVDLSHTAAELVETLVGRWADHAAVHLLDEPHVKEHVRPAYTVLRRVTVARGPRAVRPGMLLPADKFLRLPAQSPVLISLSKGETVYVPYADSLTADHLTAQLGDPQQATSLRDCSILLVPLMLGPKMLGNVMLVREPGHPAFGDDVVAASEAVVQWAARCMDRDRAYDRAARLVDELRQGFGPEPLPELAGMELCYRYLPESRTARIGGDWFDAIPLTDGRVVLVMGDVMGHGVNAAIVMNRCRTIVRTLALLGMSPDEMLRRLDELVCLHDDDHVATCLIVIYDPETRQCHAANAGQIPPVLIHPDGSGEVLDLPTGAPVGVGGLTFETRSFTAAPGTVLALCSDGLTGLHDVDIDRALARMCATLSGPARSLDEICDGVFQDLETETSKDDVTLFLTRFLGRSGVKRDLSDAP